RPGDRSRREDDRYLLLEALLSARERLYISWVGRSIRDNSERPASVLVGQLRDHLSSGWRTADDSELLSMLTLEHPLQPFSKAYFTGTQALFSYAREWLPMHSGAAAAATEQRLPDLLPDAPLEVEQLQRFLRNPAVHFFTGRLKVFLDERNDSLDDHEPFALDALQNHQLSETLLQACLPLPAEQDVEDALSHLASRLQGQGRFPLAGFGELARSQLILPLGEQMRRFQAVAAEWPEIIDNPLALEAGRHQVQLASWLSGVRTAPGSDALAR